MIRVVPKSPEHAEAARVAEIVLDDALAGHLPPEVRQMATDEAIRQILYGLPPSEGMPDLRPSYPRFDQEPIFRLRELSDT